MSKQLDIPDNLVVPVTQALEGKAEEFIRNASSSNIPASKISHLEKAVELTKLAKKLDDGR
jgi:hypothetical protein